MWYKKLRIPQAVECAMICIKKIFSKNCRTDHNRTRQTPHAHFINANNMRVSFLK